MGSRPKAAANVSADHNLEFSLASVDIIAALTFSVNLTEGHTTLRYKQWTQKRLLLNRDSCFVLYLSATPAVF